MDPSEHAPEENRRLRRTMRDLVALSTLPAVWVGLGPEGIARSLASVLLNTLPLDLVYVRLARPDGNGLVEVVRCKHEPDAGQVDAVRAALAPLLRSERSESPGTIAAPFGAGVLHVAVTRFGVGDDQGVLVTGSRNMDFPTELDRLLLGVGANQTAIVVQRRRAEERLHEQGEWLATTLASIGDAVIATDGRGHVRFMNPIAESLTGWTQGEAMGRPIEEVFHILNEHTRRPVEHPVARVLREGMIVGLANHTVLIARDGTERAIEDSAAPIKEATGVVVGAVMVFQDATERRRVENEVRAARDEAEHANRAKDQFLAVLSHELRTPLNPILLAATSMLERPIPPEELRPTLEMIRHNVLLQARLIDDLLDVMRIVQGKMPLHWEIADGHGLIRQATQICQSEVFAKQLRLDMELEAQGHHLNADPARFQQVIWNLVRNAVKFTPVGGTITIRTRNQEDEEGALLVIEVADTGIGIEPDYLSSIFDPFQQGETRITRKFGGLGLGLAICRGIVESHGGTLMAESEGKDRGTTFRVTLKTIPSPVETYREPADDASEQPTAPTPAVRILVVEDEPATRRLMARLLQGLGHEVTMAGTIASAVEALEAAEFDLIVSDIGLPDGSGLELMRRAIALRGPIAAIALTGYGMEEDIIRSRRAGFTAHMTKPIDFTKLEAMIRQVVSTGS